MRRRYAYPVATLAILALWQGAALLLRSPALPGPAGVFPAFLRAMAGPLAAHFAVSAWRVGVSLALALAAGVPAGMLMGRSRRADSLLSPFVHIAYPVPKIALLPLVLLLFGIGDLAKVFLITLMLFFQVLVTTRDAAREIPREHILSMLSLGANRRQTWRHLVLPAVLPKVLTALRIGIGTAIAVLFFVESFATSTGLGYFILDAWSRIDYSEMYAGIIGMALLGVLFYEGVEMVDRRLCRWTRA
jgi:ABC-type nitrate/sulfonate/bicarbonate transport system permease component